jgi:hypothetical protein
LQSKQSSKPHCQTPVLGQAGELEELADYRRPMICLPEKKRKQQRPARISFGSEGIVTVRNFCKGQGVQATQKRRADVVAPPKVGTDG